MSDYKDLQSRFVDLNCSPRFIEKLLKAIPSGCDERALVLLLANEKLHKSLSDSFEKTFCKLVDEGLASLSEFLKALIELSRHDYFKEASLNNILGFLYCCCEYQHLHPDSGDLSKLALAFANQVSKDKN